MDFASFKLKVEEDGQAIWEGWTKLHPEMPSYVFFYLTPSSSQLNLMPIALTYPKEIVSRTLHYLCQKEQVQHSCLMVESYMLSPSATISQQEVMKYISGGKLLKDHPDSIEVLTLMFSTIEEPHSELVTYQIMRPSGLTPFLVHLSLPQADQVGTTGRFTGFYYQGE